MTAGGDILTEVERVINRALNSARPGEVIGRFLAPPRNAPERAKKRHADRMDAVQQLYLAALRRSLARAQLETLHRLHRGTVRVENTAPAAVDFLFDLDGFSKMFFAEMRGADEEALQVSGQGLLSDLGLDEKFITPRGIIHDFVIARQNKLSNAPEEIYNSMKAALEEGIQNGETMDELAGRVKETFGEIDAGRAQTIARTETASAYNTGRMEGMRQHGMTRKSWLTAHDERVRVSHEMAEGEGAIPLDQNFSNGLAYPGDPAGAAGEVINCRCVLQAHR